MKRYAIFGASGPLIGGFLLLLTSTVTSGYWSHPPSLSEAGRLLALFARTLQYSYLFGLLPSLMLGAVDDILFHVKRIGPAMRLLIVGVAGFAGAEFLYGSRGADNGTTQFVLYGLVGLIPGAALSWLSNYFSDRPA
jgi:uncharacterized protein DUF5413